MEDKIKEWKEKYEDIYAVNILDEIYYYRSINREEYKEIYIKNLDTSEYQEQVAILGVLWPEKIDFESAGGLAESLCTLILDCSYLNSNQAKEILNQFREEMLIFDNQADCLIHEAFPEYKLEQIQNFTVRKTLYMLSRAEYILREFRGVPIAHIGMEEENLEENYEEKQEINNDFENYKNEDLYEQEKDNEEKMEYEKNKANYPELKWFETYDDLTGEYE
jgi:hypothetical protein